MDSGMESFFLQRIRNSSLFRRILLTDLLFFLILQNLLINVPIFIIRMMRAVLHTMTRISE